MSTDNDNSSERQSIELALRKILMGNTTFAIGPLIIGFSSETDTFFVVDAASPENEYEYNSAYAAFLYAVEFIVCKWNCLPAVESVFRELYERFPNTSNSCCDGFTQFLNGALMASLSYSRDVMLADGPSYYQEHTSPNIVAQ